MSIHRPMNFSKGQPRLFVLTYKLFWLVRLKQVRFGFCYKIIYHRPLNLNKGANGSCFLLVSCSKYRSFCSSRIVLLISLTRWLPCWTATANGCSAKGSPTSVKLQFFVKRKNCNRLLESRFVRYQPLFVIKNHTLGLINKTSLNFH